MTTSHAVFHTLAVEAIEPLTDDSVAITFAVPDDLRDDYAFSHGQHLTVRTELAGDDVRRNYSICSPSSSGVLRVAVKRLPGGAFSEHALDVLRPGDVLDVMTPSGRFFVSYDAFKKHYSLFAYSQAVIDGIGEPLTRHLSGRGTIRFSANEPIPTAMITDIARIRFAEVTGRPPR